jgi:isoquinoline 1-oxidoreductase subunit beta
MSTNPKLGRRSFLQAGAAAAGGLLIGFYLPEKGQLLAQGPQGGRGGAPATLYPNAFVRVGTDDIVTLTIHKPENGQGTETSIAMLLAEELECDWKKVRTEFAPINPTFYGGERQGTFGSQAVRTSWTPLRRTGAAAKDMLIQAAATRWGVDKSMCRAENSTVVNLSTNARLSYGSLADAASKLPVPANVVLKDPSQFRLLGKPMKRRDAAIKSSGQAMYAMDVKVPGMVYAVVQRSPVVGGKVASFDATKARAVPGVKHVIQIPEGIAVIAENTYAATEGRKALDVKWDEGANASLTSAAIREKLVALTSKPGAVARNIGTAEASLASAAKKVEVAYEVPYLAHAPMEPFSCVADVRADSAELWVGTQIPGIANSDAMRVAGLTADKVKLHTLYMGGGFGSRGGGEFINEAVGISKAIGTPVKLMYTREDDLAHGKFRPTSYARMAAGLDAQGWPVAFTSNIACSSFAGIQSNGVDREGVAGVADTLYSIPNVLVHYSEPGISIPTNYWRSVGHSQNTFFMEAFIDEMAAAGGKDPVELRRRLLSAPSAARLLGVLNLAAEKSNWGKPLPAGRFRGVAVVNCFGSFNAQVAEVSVTAGKLQVHRVVSAVDCGMVVNPAGIVQQQQSAIVYGLSAALRGAITFDKGRVVQTNFHQYEPLRINEMPVVEVHIVPSTEASGGMGEVGTPAIAPAVANAIFAATGKRVRQLPFSSNPLA